MYLEHFGLKDYPFRITPDPAFLFWTADHHRAFDMLTSAARGDRPVAVVLGAPGTGKTTLLQYFVAGLPTTICVGMISSYSSGLGGLGHWLHWAFHLRPEGTEDELRAAFEAHLAAQLHKGVRCLLIVDEAQNVSDDDLAVLAGLTRLPKPAGGSMRLILAGQPRLHGRLPNGRGEALDSAPLHIGAMSPEDVAGYVRHRMGMSGCLDPVFDAEALGRIARISGGVPRLVNVLCEFLLTSAFGADVRQLNAAFVDRVLQDVRQTGGLNHLLVQPGKRAPRAAPTRVRSKSVLVPARSTPTAVETPTRPTPRPIPNDEPPMKRAMAGTGAPPPRPTSPPIPDAEPTTKRAMAGTVTPSRPENPYSPPHPRQDLSATPGAAAPARPRARRASLAVIAAGAAAAAVVIAVLSSESIATALVAMQRQDDASLAPASPPAPALVTVHPALPAPPLFQGTDAAVLRDQALSVGAQDPLTTAIGFARAALRGDARAAYYLGQHFEAGDGVPRNTALAAAWYASAAETQRSARRALDTLSDTADETLRRGTAPPRPLMGIVVAGALAEFVWAAPDGAAARYLIELADSPNAPPEQHGPFDLSAALLVRASPPRLWRVVAIAPDGALISASNWHRLVTDVAETLAAAP